MKTQENKHAAAIISRLGLDQLSWQNYYILRILFSKFWELTSCIITSVSDLIEIYELALLKDAERRRVWLSSHSKILQQQSWWIWRQERINRRIWRQASCWLQEQTWTIIPRLFRYVFTSLSYFHILGFEVRRDANGFDDRRSSHQQQDRDLRNNQVEWLMKL